MIYFAATQWNEGVAFLANILNVLVVWFIILLLITIDCV